MRGWQEEPDKQARKFPRVGRGSAGFPAVVAGDEATAVRDPVGGKLSSPGRDPAQQYFDEPELPQLQLSASVPPGQRRYAVSPVLFQI